MGIIKKFFSWIFKILGRLITLLLILFVIIALGGYAAVYFLMDNNHQPYMDLIEKYSIQYNLEPEFVTAIIKTESNFRADAKSGADAYGLMQVVEDTGEWVAGRLEDEDFNVDQLFDPETNIKYGTYYLKYLINYYHSVDYAILAYNAGFGNVDLWIKEGILTGDVEDYENIPFAETKNYIKKVKSQWRLNDKIFDSYYLDNTSPKWKKALNVYKELLMDIVK